MRRTTPTGDRWSQAHQANRGPSAADDHVDATLKRGETTEQSRHACITPSRAHSQRGNEIYGAKNEALSCSCQQTKCI